MENADRTPPSGWRGAALVVLSSCLGLVLVLVTMHWFFPAAMGGDSLEFRSKVLFVGAATIAVRLVIWLLRERRRNA